LAGDTTADPKMNRYRYWR